MSHSYIWPKTACDDVHLYEIFWSFTVICYCQITFISIIFKFHDLFFYCLYYASPNLLCFHCLHSASLFWLNNYLLMNFQFLLFVSMVLKKPLVNKINKTWNLLWDNGSVIPQYLPAEVKMMTQHWFFAFL